jgi:AcrR family transcriptional regulator
MAQLGRPRTFDREVAIVQAMHLFWQHGFENTSLSQLKANIGGGISAPSFYAAFGSKEALFQEAVACYLSTYAQVTECLWDKSLEPRRAVELALRRSAKMQCEQGHPKGCMVGLAVMSAPSAENAEVTKRLTASRARTHAGFVSCVERGVAEGALLAGTDARAMAAVFNGFLLGLSTLVRDGIRHSVFDASITQVMKLWDVSTRNGP